jgi:pimeloyl-ACP methyl ester carboxylesterase
MGIGKPKAKRLLEHDCQAIRNELCFEYEGDTLYNEKQNSPSIKRRMSDAKAHEHLSVLGTSAAMNAALNWYRAGFRGRTILAQPDEPPTTVSTLYVWGNEDTSVGEMAATMTPQYVKSDCQFEVLEGIGHYVAEEAPEMLLDHLLPHLNRYRV